MKYILTVLVLFSLLIVACTKDNDMVESNCGSTPKTFSGDVNPIIQSSCATNSDCHGAGSINGPGPLLTYNHVFNARAAIRSAVSNGSMPKTGSITAAQKSSVVCWVENGGANN
jgi:hypothetical protein